MSFLGPKSIVWFNGEFVDDKKASVSVASHGLHYGSGIFEGVRAYETENGTAIFRLTEHTQRLFNSARLIGMQLPFDIETLNQAQKEVIRRNHFPAAYLRPVAFYGDDSLGVHPGTNKVQVAIAAWEWKSYFNAEEVRGISVAVSTFRRHHISSVFTKAKVNGHYINSMLALQEARKKGCQEALLFDHSGFIAEGSSANVFLVKDGVIYTPTDANILPGITRDSVITLSRDLGYKVVEKNLTRDELHLVDEMFFSGTAAEITPVGIVDDLLVGDGNIGPVTSQIKEAFHQVVRGGNNKYKHWNHKV